MIQHTVTFHLNAAADRATFFARARALGDLPGVQHFEVLRQIGQKKTSRMNSQCTSATARPMTDSNNHAKHLAFVNDVWLPNVADFVELDYVREKGLIQ